MDQQLKFTILNDVIGSEKIDAFRNKISSLAEINSTLVNLSSATFLLQKGFDLASNSIGAFKNIIDFGDELEAISERTGISAQALSGFKAAADQSNISFETLQKNLKKFTQQLGDSNNTKFQQQLVNLGVNAIDPVTHKMKDAGTIVENLADKFSVMENGPRKAAISMFLFGKSGDQMIPFLNQGSEALEKFGVKFSNAFSVNADAFNDNMSIIKNQFKQNLVDIVDGALPSLLKLEEAISGILTRDQSGNNSFGKMLVEYLSIAIDYGYRFWAIMADGLDSIKTVFQYLGAQIGSILGALGQLKNGFSAAMDAWKNGVVESRKVWEDFGNRVSERNKNIMALSKAATEINSGQVADAQKKVNKGESPNLFDEKADAAIKKFILTQQEQIRVEKLKLDSYKMTAAELQKATITEQLHLQAQKESVGFSKEYKDKMMEATEEIIKQRKELIDLGEQQKRSFGVGAQTALRDYLENIRNVSKQTEKLFSSAFQNMEDALVDFVKTGQLSFKKFADAVIDQLIRIAVQQATLGILTSFGVGVASAQTSASASQGAGYLGAQTTFHANGGIMTSMGSVPLRAYASGGIASRPQAAIFGEGSTPEAFVPLPDGRSIPVSMKGSSGNISVVVNVNMTTGEQSTSGSDSAKGQQLALAVSSLVKEELIKQKRPGGIIYS